MRGGVAAPPSPGSTSPWYRYCPSPFIGRADPASGVSVLWLAGVGGGHPRARDGCDRPDRITRGKDRFRNPQRPLSLDGGNAREQGGHAALHLWSRIGDVRQIHGARWVLFALLMPPAVAFVAYGIVRYFH